MYANEIKKLLEKYFKKKCSCKIAYEVKVNSSVLDMLVMTYNPQTKKIYKLIGVEIKSDLDKYTRLKNQLRDYYKICDKVYLAVESKGKKEWMPLGLGLLRINQNIVNEEITAMDISKFHVKHDIPLKVLEKTLYLSLNKKINSKLLLSYIQTVDDVKKKLWFNKLFGIYWDDERLYKQRLNNQDVKDIIPFSKKELKLVKLISNNV